MASAAQLSTDSLGKWLSASHQDALRKLENGGALSEQVRTQAAKHFGVSSAELERALSDLGEKIGQAARSQSSGFVGYSQATGAAPSFGGARENATLGVFAARDAVRDPHPSKHNQIELVTRKPDELRDRIYASIPAAKDLIRFDVAHGDLYTVQGPAVSESRFPELVFDILAREPGKIGRGLFALRLFLGKITGIDSKAPPTDYKPWKSPDEPIRTGDYVSLFKVVHSAPDELVLFGENSIVRAYLTLKRDGDRLEYGAMVDPKGAAGVAYWKAIQPFHGYMYKVMLGHVGKTLEDRIAGKPTPAAWAPVDMDRLPSA
jgi:hypothetical protein